MNDSQALRFYMSTDDVVAKATPEARARLLSHAEVVTMDADLLVFEPSTDAGYSYYVVQGSVYLYTRDRQLPVLVSKGHYFGQEAGVNAVTYATRAVVKEPVTLIKIPNNAMEGMFRDNMLCENLFVNSLFKTYFGKELMPRPRRMTYEERAREALPFSEVLGWLYTIIVPICIMVFLESALPDKSSRIFLALLSIALCMWVFETVSAYIPGIFLIVSVLALGIAPSKLILGGFASETFITALSIYGLGSVIIHSGIIYRSFLSILKYIPENQFWLNITAFVMGLFLTPTVPAAVHRASIMGSIVSDFVFHAKLKPGGHGATRLAISAYSGTMLFSAIFLSSSLHNFIILGLLWAQDQERFQWLGWLQAAAVPGLVMTFFFGLCIIFWGGVSEKISINRDRIQEQAVLLGKKSIREQMALICYLMFTIGVMTSSLHRLSPMSIGLMVLFALTSFNVLSREHFQKTIDWPSLILLGGLIGVMAVFDYLGIGVFLLNHIEWAGQYLKQDFRIFAFVLLILVLVVRLIVPYGPAVIILATLFMPIAQQYEVNSWVVSFIILFWGKMWFFPRQYPPYGTFIDNCGADDLFDKESFMRFNFLMNIARIIAVFVAIPYWKSMGLV